MASRGRFILFGLFSTLVYAWNHASELELQKALKTQDYTLVAFVEPDGWNSQILETEWSMIVDPDKNLLSINCAKDSKICENNDVRSFPAIRLYRSGGEMRDPYRGPRRASDITAFVNRSLRPIVSGLEPSNVTAFGTVDDFVFILHLTDNDAGKGLYKRFHDLASNYGDRYSFGVVSREETEGASSLNCYNNLDDVQRSTESFFENINSLNSFFKTCVTRLVPEMTHGNKRDYTKSKAKVLYHFDFYSNDREKYASSIRGVAKTFVDDIKFVTVDPSLFPDVPASVGLKWNFPAIALQDKTTGLMFPSERNNDITPDFVQKFLRSVTDGSARPAFQDPIESVVKEQVDVDAASNKGDSAHDEL